MKNIALNGKQFIYPGKEKLEVCNYNPKCFMPLVWIIDDIIMNLFINAERIEKNHV